MQQNGLTITNRDFTLLAESRTVIFSGTWKLHEYITTIQDHSASSFDFLINLDYHNYLIHPEDHAIIKEMIADLRPGHPVHLRTRVISPAGRVSELDASGSFDSTEKTQRDNVRDFHRNQNLINSILDNTSSSIVALKPVVNPSGIIIDLEYVFANKQTLRSAGRESLVGKRLLQEFPEIKTKTDLFERYCLVIETGSTWNGTVYMDFAGMSEMWARVNAVKWEECCLVTCIDITEEKKSEQEIIRLKEEIASHITDKYLTLFNSIDEGIAVAEPVMTGDEITDFRIVETNPAYEKHTRAARVVGKTVREVFPGTDQPWLTRMEQVMRTGEPVRLESYSLQADRWFNACFSKIGSSNLIAVVFNDITDRKRSEQASRENEDRHRGQLEKAVVDRTKEILHMQEIIAQQAQDKYLQLFNSIDQGFCIIEMMFDENGKGYDYRFLETNPAFSKQTGIVDAETKTILELAPGHEPHWFEIYARVARERVAERFVHQARSLENRWYDVYAFPTGKPEKYQVAILFHDITNRKRAEFELKKLNAELKELDHAKTTFFGNISHEFRTPIMLLLGPLAELINDSPTTLSKAQADKVSIAYRNALRLQKLVNSLLDFSRFEVGQADAVFQPIDLVKFTTELAGNFRSAIEEAGLKLVVKHDELNEPVYLNPDMYEKIVLNLLSNAFKFTFKGRIEVTIRNKKKKVELRIRDTGIGIAQQNQHRIFERFNRVEASRSRTFEGTGIGLALVKEMVGVLGGSITLKSVPGEGSEFIVIFPKGKDHLDPEKIYQSKNRLTVTRLEPYLEEMKGWIHGSDTSSGTVTRHDEHYMLRPTVLLVDDNADMLNYLSAILESNFQVIKAQNGKKAWEIIKFGFIPDVVLADVMMPEMNGLELLEYIKSNEKYERIPVILISARADEASRIEGMNSGADDYLVKPFSTRELIARVNARIQIARQREQAEGQLAVNNELLEELIRKRTSELKRSNDSLERKNHELEALYDELSNLTFVASHDLREPLRKLNIFTEIIMREEKAALSENGKDYLRKMNAFVQRMNDLLADISNYTTFSSDPIRIGTTSMNELVRSVRASLKHIIDSSSIIIKTDLRDLIKCDAEQIKQLVCQLLANAIKFREPHRLLQIVISGNVVPGATLVNPLANKEINYYKLEVKDNGIGFEQKFESRIFHMFRKLHHQIDYPGTGIGLAICRKIVENHNGFIVAKSSEGQGSSFCAYIPQ